MRPLKLLIVVLFPSAGVILFAQGKPRHPCERPEQRWSGRELSWIKDEYDKTEKNPDSERFKPGPDLKCADSRTLRRLEACGAAQDYGELLGKGIRRLPSGEWGKSMYGQQPFPLRPEHFRETQEAVCAAYDRRRQEARALEAGQRQRDERAKKEDKERMEARKKRLDQLERDIGSILGPAGNALPEPQADLKGRSVVASGSECDRKCAEYKADCVDSGKGGLRCASVKKLVNDLVASGECSCPHTSR